MELSNINPEQLQSKEQLQPKETVSQNDEFKSTNELTPREPLSNESKFGLKEQGFSDSIIDAIGSEEEKKIYENANVEFKTINGKDVLVKIDIDFSRKDDFGQTNLERMEKGLAPLDQNGNPLELHHIGQDNKSPLVELTREEHRGKGNDSILHDKTKESCIDREVFAKERSDHWKARSEDVIKSLGE